MSSILKVDTIQDQSGNNIINESGNVITIGASGDTITVPAGATLSGDLNADNLTSGTVPDARISGAYTNLTSLTITTADNSHALELISTDADASVGPRLSLYRNSASPADGDILGDIRFMAEDDAGDKLEFAKIDAKALDVSSGSRDTQLKFQIRHSNSGNDILTLTPTEVVFNDGSFDTDFRIESNNNANMLFVNAGTDRVGIGTSSPQNTLHVTKNALSGASYRTNAPLILENSSNNELQILSGNSNDGQIRFGDGDANFRGAMTYAHSDDSMRFVTNASEAMRIDSSGNLLVGTTSSFGSSGITLGSNVVYASASSQNVANFQRYTTDGEIVRLGKDGTTLGGFHATGGTIDVRRQSGTNGLMLKFSQPTHGVVGAIGNTSVDFYITNNSSGSTNTGIKLSNNNKIVPMENASNSDNVTDLGGSSQRFKDLYLGGGLYVGGTGTANKLDDYEEGTFTPVLRIDGGAGTQPTQNVQRGNYVKVGNQVTCILEITASGTSLASGDLDISGLPFTSNSSPNARSSGCLRYIQRIDYNDFLLVGIAHSTTNITLLKSTSSTTNSASSLTSASADFSSGSGAGFNITITYFTD